MSRSHIRPDLTRGINKGATQSISTLCPMLCEANMKRVVTGRRGHASSWQYRKWLLRKRLMPTAAVPATTRTTRISTAQSPLHCRKIGKANPRGYRVSQLLFFFYYLSDKRNSPHISTTFSVSHHRLTLTHLLLQIGCGVGKILEPAVECAKLPIASDTATAPLGEDQEET